jgi:hypothetical protein
MTSTHGKILAAVLAVSTYTTAFAAEVDRRQANQQARIAEGVKSGQLTPHETARLERKEAKIRREVRRDRAANGGKLTAAEKARVNRQEDRTSRQIDRAKHNDNRM